jgi:autotransporter-associated beta strand protein
LSKQTVLTNGATLYSDGETGTSNALNGAITLYGANTIQVNQVALGILSAISGTGGFLKTGSGTLYLPAANTYSGSTTISAGNILLGPSGSIANSTNISVAASTVLDASAAGGLNLGSGKTLAGSGSVSGNVSLGSASLIAPGTAAAAGTLTLNNNLTINGTTNLIKLGSDPSTIGGGVNDLISVAGNLTASGVSTILISPLGVLSSASPYTVMQYSGPTPSAANFQVASTSPRYTPTLVDPATTPGSIQVNITGVAGLLVWKGGATAASNVWNNVATNWLNLSTSLRDAYLPGDNAIFDDTSVTNFINLTTTAAGLISLSNNTMAYTLTGSGLIAGSLDMEGTSSFRIGISNPPVLTTITANYGTLIYDVQSAATFTNYATISDGGGAQGTIVKAATNKMVLAADNSSFSGNIVVSNGVLQFTNAANLGSASAGLYVTNAGTLDLNGIALSGKAITIAGNGLNGQGALVNFGNNLVNAGVNNLTLTGDATIGAINRFDIIGGGTVNGNGFKLTEVGPGANLFTGGAETFLGDIHIVAGRLGFQANGTTMGDTTKTCTVESNAVLTLFNAGTQTKNLVLNGNATIDAGGTASTFNGLVTLAGTNNLFGLRVDLHVSGNVGGAGSLVAGDSPVGAGSGNLYLDGANTYTGSTIINGGHAIIVGASSSLGASSRVQVNSGGTLDVSAPPSLTLGSGQALIGAGTVAGGAVVLGSGGTLAPGLGGSDTSTLTMTGSLTLQSGSTNAVVVNKTTGINNSQVISLASAAISGTLVVNSVGSSLASGDAIQLFSASSYSGGFANIIPATPGANLLWDVSTLNTDGKLRVASGLPTTRTNIIISVAGNQLTLSWPSNYTGWTLQGQTNPVGVGLTTNWHDVPGSTATNRLTFPIGAAGSVFYRMILK